VPASERKREIRRRRKRREKITQYKVRAPKASTSEKAVLAEKIRKITPGAEEIITALSLEER